MNYELGCGVWGVGCGETVLSPYHPKTLSPVS
jgi:hypothetical protein